MKHLLSLRGDKVMNFLGISFIVSALISLLFAVLGANYQKPELNEAAPGEEIHQVEEVAEQLP